MNKILFDNILAYKCHLHTDDIDGDAKEQFKLCLELGSQQPIADIWKVVRQIPKSQCPQLSALRQQVAAIDQEILERPRNVHIDVQQRKKLEPELKSVFLTAEAALVSNTNPHLMQQKQAANYILHRSDQLVVKQALMGRYHANTRSKIGSTLAKMIRYATHRMIENNEVVEGDSIVRSVFREFAYKTHTISEAVVRFMTWLIAERSAVKKLNIRTFEDYGSKLVLTLQALHPGWNISLRAKANDIVSAEALSAVRVTVHRYDQQEGGFSMPKRDTLTVRNVEELVANANDSLVGRQARIGVATIILLSSTGVRPSSLLQKRTRKTGSVEYDEKKEVDRIKHALNSSRCKISWMVDGQVKVEVKTVYSKVAGSTTGAPIDWVYVDKVERNIRMFSIAALLIAAGACTVEVFDDWLKKQTGSLKIVPNVCLWRSENNGAAEGACPSSLDLIVRRGIRALKLPTRIYSAISCRRGYATTCIDVYCKATGKENPVLSPSQIVNVLSATKHWRSNSANLYISDNYRTELTGALAEMRTKAAFRSMVRTNRPIRRVCWLDNKAESTDDDMATRERTKEQYEDEWKQCEQCECHANIAKYDVDVGATMKEWRKEDALVLLQRTTHRQDDPLFCINRETPEKEAVGALEEANVPGTSTTSQARAARALSSPPSKRSRRNRSPTPEWEMD